MRIIKGKARKSLLVQQLASGERKSTLIIDLVGFKNWQAHKHVDIYESNIAGFNLAQWLNEFNHPNIYVYGNFDESEIESFRAKADIFADRIVTITVQAKDNEPDDIVLKGF